MKPISCSRETRDSFCSSLFLCFSVLCFEFLSFLDHVIHNLLNLYILLHYDLILFFWPAPFFHLEDAADMNVHVYLTLRTAIACRGLLSSFLSLAGLSHISMLGC